MNRETIGQGTVPWSFVKRGATHARAISRKVRKVSLARQERSYPFLKIDAGRRLAKINGR